MRHFEAAVVEAVNFNEAGQMQARIDVGLRWAEIAGIGEYMVLEAATIHIQGAMRVTHQNDSGMRVMINMLTGKVCKPIESNLCFAHGVVKIFFADQIRIKTSYTVGINLIQALIAEFEIKLIVAIVLHHHLQNYSSRVELFAFFQLIQQFMQQPFEADTVALETGITATGYGRRICPVNTGDFFSADSDNKCARQSIPGVKAPEG